MEVSIISKEIIKPNSTKFIHQSNLKVSSLDQLIPSTYVPLILFYPSKDDNYNILKHSQISSQFKNSLSETLSSFYPLCGRIKDNLFIYNYEVGGVPFTETQVKKISLFDFLKNPDRIELLNQFLPCQPFTRINSQEEAKASLVSVQLNIFDCGGIALGFCMSHKIADGATISTFLKSWANNLKGFSGNNVMVPDFSEASLRFPPLETYLSSQYLSFMEKLWFYNDHKHSTKRFVFNANAISALQAKAKGEKLQNPPSRIKAISSFIWKSYTAASRSVSALSRPSLSIHAVNIRQRAEPKLPEYFIGNLFWWAVAACDLADAEKSLQDFVALTDESISKINVDYLNNLQSDREGLKEFVNELMELSLKKPEMFVFSSWVNFGINDLDFGWGKPIWVGFTGELGPGFTNFTMFKECTCNNGIEAWITLDSQILEILEEDPEFLKFATPNPSIL